MRDEDYLFISGMLKARRSAVLDRERLERLLSADTAAAARLLAEYGFGDVEGLDAHRHAATIRFGKDAATAAAADDDDDPADAPAADD